MPAYGFRPRFEDPLLAGLKPHTIRADRKDGRVPKVGEAFHAYIGMRTKKCRKLFESRITRVQRVVMKARNYGESIGIEITIDGADLTLKQCQQLAERDGFEHFREFIEHFFPAVKKGPTEPLTFTGWLIWWDTSFAKSPSPKKQP